MADHVFGGIKIRHLYKIFGPNAATHIEAVKNGLTKAELNAKYGHVLGLRDINIERPSGSIQVIMGLSGSGKSTLIRHINRLIDPTAGEVLVDGTDVVKMQEAELREFRRGEPVLDGLDMACGVRTEDFVEMADLDAAEGMVSHGRSPCASAGACHRPG